MNCKLFFHFSVSRRACIGLIYLYSLNIWKDHKWSHLSLEFSLWDSFKLYLKFLNICRTVQIFSFFLWVFWQIVFSKDFTPFIYIFKCITLKLSIISFCYLCKPIKSVVLFPFKISDISNLCFLSLYETAFPGFHNFISLFHEPTFSFMSPLIKYFFSV